MVENFVQSRMEFAFLAQAASRKQRRGCWVDQAEQTLRLAAAKVETLLAIVQPDLVGCVAACPSTPSSRLYSGSYDAEYRMHVLFKRRSNVDQTPKANSEKRYNRY